LHERLTNPYFFQKARRQGKVVVMGPGQFFVARVGSAIFGLGLENFPLKIPKFSIFFLSDQKKFIGSGQKVPESKTGQPLIYRGSKVCSGQGPSLSDAKLKKTKFFIMFYFKR